ncbi:transcriptional regulator [Psychrobacter sp. 72-O-c]|uniref:transcriptional regulator n=1 Tax=Psychrobacter sp. 72-O-c TaxID=2774125 RepID=UPI00191848A6|nr:YdaS family helix-turn-helix protein [Psychrobacter sp. 72-O-c]
MTISPKQALEKAINNAGSQTNLAKLLGLKNASQISSMLNRDGKCSTKYVVKVSQVTGVPCHELRPDVFPEPANDASNQQDLA